VIFIAAMSYGAQLIALGIAYKAKMLCSEVFVAGRNIDSVLADLVVEDLKILRFIDTSVDRVERTTTASLFGFGVSKFRYRDVFGCALVSDTMTTTPWGINKRGLLTRETYTRLKDEQSIKSRQLIGVENPQLAAILDDIFSETNSEYRRRTRAVVVLHKGRIVAERYALEIGPDTPILGWSMAKSVMNALVGILVKEGRITLETPILAKEWHELNDSRRNIKLKHLLQMSSGLNFNEDMTDPLADVSRMILREKDMATFAASKPLEAEPGSRWQYSSGNTNILSEFLHRILGEEKYHKFPREALFNRLGMTRAVLETDATGTFVGSSYMYATAREWARFGQLYLQDGVWDGERILPQGWVKYTRTPVPADPKAAYGAHFWLRIPKEYRGTGNTMPVDAIHAVGHEAQFVTIVPSQNTVIVRLGKTRNPQAWEHDVFISNVIKALQVDK